MWGYYEAFHIWKDNTSGHLLSFYYFNKKMLRYLLIQGLAHEPIFEIKNSFIESPSRFSGDFEKNAYRPLPNDLNYQMRKVLSDWSSVKHWGGGPPLISVGILKKIRHRPMWGYYEAFHIWNLVMGSKNCKKKCLPRGSNLGLLLTCPMNHPVH